MTAFLGQSEGAPAWFDLRVEHDGVVGQLARPLSLDLHRLSLEIGQIDHPLEKNITRYLLDPGPILLSNYLPGHYPFLLFEIFSSDCPILLVFSFEVAPITNPESCWVTTPSTTPSSFPKFTTVTP